MPGSASGSVLLGACAGSAGRTAGSFASREVLTREQIDGANATNAYEAVERLRSRWLRRRGTTQMPSDGGGAIYVSTRPQDP